jgi:tRNA(adenine34) deaminase
MVFDDTYFMQQAMQLAHQAYQEDEVPVGAIIVAQNRIIGKGYNLTERLHDVTAHAEMQAITAAANTLGGKYLKDCTLYVTLEPCTMCAGALYWSQLSRVVIACKDEKHGYLSKKIKLHPKTTIEFVLLEEESKALLQSFFKQKRK